MYLGTFVKVEMNREFMVQSGEFTRENKIKCVCNTKEQNVSFMLMWLEKTQNTLDLYFEYITFISYQLNFSKAEIFIDS